jgi:hypothetical protein
MCQSSHANRVLLCIQEGLGAGGVGTLRDKCQTGRNRLRLRSYLFYTAALYGPNPADSTFC